MPEWEEGYIAYGKQSHPSTIQKVTLSLLFCADKLKAMIKEFSTSKTSAEEKNLEAEFFQFLESDLEKVNDFYVLRVEEFERELEEMKVEMAKSSGRPRGNSISFEADATRDRAMQLHTKMGHLQAYVWLNTQGFEKIMKKYDKFMDLRHTAKAKSPDFEARLKQEVFKDDRLSKCLERLKLLQAQLNKDSGNLDLKLISGSANKELAYEIAARLGVSVSESIVKRFNDGEVNIQLCDSVRGCSVFIVQPTCPNVNDNLIQLLLLISAARRASAASVTAIVPYYGYARQDRKVRAREPISAADVSRMMEAMGVDRVVCVDLHCAQIQGFFGPRTPVDNLFAAPIAVHYFRAKNLTKPVIISPDAGGVARAKFFMERFANLTDAPEISLAVILKQREGAGKVKSMDLVGSVEGCDCIIVDDMIDSAGTLTTAADELKTFGARRIFAYATHGLFSANAGEKIQKCALEEVVVANTIPKQKRVFEATTKIRMLSVGRLLAGAIRAIHTGTSVSALFDSKSAMIESDIVHQTNSFETAGDSDEDEEPEAK